MQSRRVCYFNNMLRNLVVRNACRPRPSIQMARGLCRHQTRRLMASSPQQGRSYDSKQEKTAGFIMGILSMAGALYFIAPNRKPLFAARKVESDKTAEEELSNDDQSSDNGENDDNNDSQTEAGAQLSSDKIGASEVAEDGELVVLAEDGDKAAGDEEAHESIDDEQPKDGEQSDKNEDERIEDKEESAGSKSHDDGTESSKETEVKDSDKNKTEQVESENKEPTDQSANVDEQPEKQDQDDSKTLEAQPEVSGEAKEALRKQEEKQMGPTEEEVQRESAYNPDTGEINWDCPCLGGMAHGPCGEEFKSAFSCFVYSEAEPKGINCVEKFQHMQDCFRKYPEHYEEQLKDTLDDKELHGEAKTNTIESAPHVSNAKENAAKKAEKSDVKKEPLNEDSKPQS